MADPGWSERWGLVEGAPFRIGGTDIWREKWRPTGQALRRTDPLYGETYSFQVWKIDTRRGPCRFAAGELSANVWAILHPPGD